MQCHNVKDISPYLSADSTAWQAVSSTRVDLVPSILPMQPSAYIRNSFADRPYGKTPFVDLRAVHDGETFAANLSWQEEQFEGGQFPTAAALAMPLEGRPPLVTMGAPGQPVFVLYWNSKRNNAASMLIEGIGSSTKDGPNVRETAVAQKTGNQWQLTLSRAMGHGGKIAPLAAGQPQAIGLAIWNGSNNERAGIKAFSPNWLEIQLD